MALPFFKIIQYGWFFENGEFFSYPIKVWDFGIFTQPSTFGCVGVAWMTHTLGIHQPIGVLAFVSILFPATKMVTLIAHTLSIWFSIFMRTIFYFLDLLLVQFFIWFQIILIWIVEIISLLRLYRLVFIWSDFWLIYIWFWKWKLEIILLKNIDKLLRKRKLFLFFNIDDLSWLFGSISHEIKFNIWFLLCQFVVR